MSFFRKLFGNGDPLEPLRRAGRQQAWADLLARGSAVDASALDSVAREEYGRLMQEGGDRLAEINLFEAEACLRGGHLQKAEEHLSLAHSQARSEDLLDRIRQMRQSMEKPRTVAAAIPVASVVAAASSCCSSGCSSAGHPPADTSQGDGLDDAIRMELIVTAYPADYAPRYLRLGGSLREAVLQAHEGMDQEALELFGHVPVPDRDDLFHFERGALMARLGRVEEGRQDLERALAINPRHLLAEETLIDLLLGAGDLQKGEGRLLSLLARGDTPAFCHARLAVIENSRGNRDDAIAQGRKALEYGNDPQALLLTASLLEGAGELAEAERLFSRFPTGGCGGHNLPLAEFWVRHGKNLEKALSAFQGALRHEPGNPRWKVRIAQTYLGTGRVGEAQVLLQHLEPSILDPELQKEAAALAERCQASATP